MLADGTIREYTYARGAGKRRRSPYVPDAVARIIEQWRLSPEWKRLAPSSIKHYEQGLRRLDEFRRMSIGEIRRRDMLAIRDAIADTRGNGAANNFIGAVSALMTFALDREHIETHPLMKVRRLPTGEWRRWPEEAIQYALGAFPPHMARAVVLALYTGQRSGDCTRMLWTDFDGEGIAVKQQKTGRRLWLPCHDDLKAALATWPRTTVTILANAHGRSWRVESFQGLMHREIRKHIELHGLQFHGLRKSAAARLAEAGCTALEIAAITGHRTLSQVEHYTQEVDQRRLASAAIVKLHETAKNGR